MADEFDTVTIPELDNLNLALTSYFATSNLNGKLGKATVQELVNFIAPFVQGIASSGFVATTGTVLPTATAGKFTFVGAGTFTQTTGGSIVTTQLLNLLAANGTSWSLILAIPIISPTAKIPVWTAQVFTSDSVVSYIGKYWRSNAATATTDIPGTSTKWLEDLTAYGVNSFEANFNTVAEKYSQIKVAGDNTATFSITANPSDIILVYKATASTKIKDFEVKIATSGNLILIKLSNGVKTIIGTYVVTVGSNSIPVDVQLAANDYVGYDNTSTARLFVKTTTGFNYWLGAALVNQANAQISMEVYALSASPSTFATVLNGDINPTKLTTGFNSLIADRSKNRITRDIRYVEYSFSTRSPDTYGFKSDRAIRVRRIGVKIGTAGVIRFISYNSDTTVTTNLTGMVSVVSGFNYIDLDVTIAANTYIGFLSNDTSASIRATTTGQGTSQYWQTTALTPVNGDLAIEIWEQNTVSVPTISDFKFKSTRDFGVNIFDFGYNVYADGVTDDTAGIQQAINDLKRNGGGTLFFPKGFYTLTGTITIDESYTGSGIQSPLRLVGEGMNSTGKTAYKRGSTIFQVYASTGQASLYTRATGFLGIEGISFDQKAGSIPMIKTMYTTLHVKGCAFMGSFHSGLTCDTDAIILGGEVEYEAATIRDDGGFQGYGTVIRDNHFNNIRRAVYGKVFANAVSVCDNSIWAQAGSNLAGGAAIEFDNVDASGVQQDCGGMISGNLIELKSYPYGIKLGKTTGFYLNGNNMYDPGAQTLGCYYLGQKSTKNIISPGFSPAIGSGYGNVPLIVDVSTNKDNRLIQGVLIP